ncbi:MAG: DUF1552 domain-containing protein [Vicinamibacterales bacterium]|jgi:hypothetical protein|nr:DUF1552 domain-containing protein [Vicinamibacterales bacterium]MDP7480636.1 DUF1552 domain-containing protein [Vicinamibacterales bacterium]MDP7692190.1 DUF1552 domain-containing protein [Vicinamibacterales bacterium]HJN45751.1 DUF1552 domain-containing protein [Vicinamibacterales bacterium]|tara:strand:+ start:137 stop:1468 length:1332 start_codon:yes stop_codon:yes gene_type:complete
MVITKLTLPRRTFLRGMGATLALPLLDAMVPALSARAPATPRFAAIYVGNGMNMFDWTPPTEGVGFELSPTLRPLEPFRDRMLVFSGLDNYPATDQGDTGGQHPRAAPAFMSSVHPKQTEGADILAGTTVDQMIAELICRDSKLSSLEVAVDRNDVVGACDHGYACAYMNSISWKSPTQPLPAETNPRFAFERLFGSGDSAEERAVRVQEDRSILDGLSQEIAALSSKLGGHDRTKLGEYLDAIRDVEQRIAKAESTNSDFEVPDRPVGVPETFREYAELMFDLQVLAFQADVTRVTSFMMARENINRTYNEIGLPEAHHAMSHHGNNPEKMQDFAKLNTYHVDTFAYYLDRLRSIPDGDGTLLDGTVVLYGSGMSDGNTHNNYNVPTVVIGGPEKGLQGNRHLVYPKGTPLANLSLSLMDKFGVQVERFGDSTGQLPLLSGV